MVFRLGDQYFVVDALLLGLGIAVVGLIVALGTWYRLRLQ